MTTVLKAGQKFRFTGRNSGLRAQLLATEIGSDACIRRGNEIELTCDCDIEFTPHHERPVFKRDLGQSESVTVLASNGIVWTGLRTA